MIISNNNFKVEIPQLNPLSLEYKAFWKDFKRKCMEGMWSGGKYMPGPLFFYVNAWTIWLNKTNYDKSKTTGKPLLRDLEWEKGYIFLEARGFSGFKNDNKYTCFEKVKGYDELSDFEKGLITLSPNCYNSKGKLKEYISVREYLRKIHPIDLGKPLFENQAKNVIDIESRGGGKSYNGASLIGWNFLFDGAFDYDEYMLRKKQNEPLASETLVGAVDTKYSGDLLSKVALGLDNLPGTILYNNKKYPSPISRDYMGSFKKSGDFIEAVRSIKEGGRWVKVGSKSKIHHRSFQANSFAGNGTRPGFTALEEIGLFSNLVETLGALKDVTRDGSNKFGSIWCFGTGGDMEGQSTLAAQQIFYNPEEYDCLVFDDRWEGSGNIGFFVPATLVDNVFKDEEGITDEVKALAVIEKERATAKKAGNDRIINDLLQNRPLKPSEAFLTMEGNIFPVADLKDHLNELLKDSSLLNASWKIELGLKDNEVVEKLSNKIVIKDFPYQNKLGTDCAIEIFQRPKKNNDGKVPWGRYIAGCLLPGEKVLTEKGLLNVENISKDIQLINQEGKLVNIIDCLQYDKVEEDIYTIGMCNTFRTTTFTKEHPILVANNIDEEFNYVTVAKIKEGQWTKIPNLYKEYSMEELDKLLPIPENIHYNLELAEKAQNIMWAMGIFSVIYKKDDKYKLHFDYEDNSIYLTENKEYIYLKINNITKSKYTGKVYNFHCETNTFMCHHITTHNCDPVDDDGVQSYSSLQSTFVLDAFTDEIVVEYTARPKLAKDYYEQVRRLLMMYNATCLYEKNKKGMYQYFDVKNSLYLLADTPKILSDIEEIKFSSIGNQSKGVQTNTSVIKWGLQEIQHWLETKKETNTKTYKILETIRSTALLRELIVYNEKINADRVSALIMLMILRQDRIKISDSLNSGKKTYKVTDDPFWKQVFNRHKGNRNTLFNL